MPEFSELLKEYIEKSPYNHAQLSKLCGINRSLLQKYLSGERKPASRENVVSLMQHLMLTDMESRQLIEAYEISKTGKSLYFQRKSITNLIHRFSYLTRQHFIETNQSEIIPLYSKETLNVISGFDNICVYLQDLLYFETAKEKTDIQLLIQNHNATVYSLIKGICNYPHITIRHLLNLSQMRNDSEENNVNVLIEILPLLFGNCQYESRYYYGNQTPDIAVETSLRNIILINQYTLLFDDAFHQLIVYQHEPVKTVFSEQFSTIWKQAKSFAIPHDDVENVLHMFQCQNYICVQGVPCLSLGFSKSLLSRFMNLDIPNIERYLDEYVSYIQNLREQWTPASKPILCQFISKTGCRKFLKEGYLCEIPNCFHAEPLSPKARLFLMEQFYLDIEKGMVQAYIVKDDFLDIDKNILIELLSNQQIFLTDLTNNYTDFHYTCISETSIITAFSDYFENYITQNGTFTQEETLAILKELIESYRKEVEKASAPPPAE